MAKMWLQDVDTGEFIKAAENGALNTYTFNMQGATERHFRWVYSKKGNKGE